MTIRKKKILIIQIFLFLSAFFVIFKTYVNLNKKSSEKILSDETKQQISKKLKNDDSSGNLFYNIVYTGLDLSGNRYEIEAKEANNSNQNDGFVNLKGVHAVFYFKDNKSLNITSNYGLYNNKTLDMKFEKNVVANYEDSILLAEKAEYFNSMNFIEISQNVKIKDTRGSMVAEKLIFDLKTNKLNISSYQDKKVKANLNYK